MATVNYKILNIGELLYLLPCNHLRNNVRAIEKLNKRFINAKYGKIFNETYIYIYNDHQKWMHVTMQCIVAYIYYAFICDHTCSIYYSYVIYTPAHVYIYIYIRVSLTWAPKKKKIEFANAYPLLFFELPWLTRIQNFSPVKWLWPVPTLTTKFLITEIFYSSLIFHYITVQLYF